MAVCYLLTQLARIGSILLLLALPLNTMFGWDIQTIIICTGIATLIYTLLGGIAAVVWTDAIQGIILIVGALACAAILTFTMPEDPRTAVRNRRSTRQIQPRQFLAVADRTDLLGSADLRPFRQYAELRHRPELRTALYDHQIDRRSP